MSPARVLRTEWLVRNRWVALSRQEVVLPNGHTVPDYHVLHEPDFVMGFAVTEEQHVLLVRQYKHGIGAFTLELPAGVVDEDDASPEEAMRRELLEETGFVAAEVRPLGVLVPNPTRATGLAHHFLLTGCRRVAEPAPDATETITVVTEPLHRIPGLVGDGTLCVQACVACVALALGVLPPATGASVG